MSPPGPSRYALYQQILKLRELLAEVARGLERRAAAGEVGADERRALATLAQWIRRQLHRSRSDVDEEGQPSDEPRT